MLILKTEMLISFSGQPLFALVLFLVVVQGQVIYISPSGTTWTGSCQSSCSSASPCAVPNSAVSSNTATQCELHFKTGNYSGRELRWSSGADFVNVTFEDGVSYLNLSLLFTATSPRVNWWSNSSSSLARMTSLNIFSRYAVGASPIFEFTKLAFDPYSSFIISTGVTSTTTFNACTFDRNHLVQVPFFSLGAVGDNAVNQILFYQSSISSTPGSYPFMRLDMRATIEYYNTTFVGESIAEAYSRVGWGDSYWFLFTGSSDFRFYGPSLIAFDPAYNLDTPIMDITIQTDFHGGSGPISKRSSQGSTSAQSYGASITPIGSQPIAEFWHGQVQSFSSLQAHASRMHLNCSGTFEARASDFDSCAFDISLLTINDRGTFSQSNFTISTDESYLNISILNQAQFEVSNAMVQVDSSQISRQPFIIDTLGSTVEIAPYNSLTANALWLTGGSHLVMENLTVTEMISSTGGSFGIISSSSTSTSTTWSFNSIVTTNIILNMTNLDTLKYVATSPELGIRIEPSSILPVEPPSTIVFDCPDTNGLASNFWFPLMNQLSTIPLNVTWIGTPTINPIVGFNSNILQYRFSNLPSVPSTTPQFNCPPPPTGFSCLDGVWVSDGVDGNVTAVTVPGNSGVIQVVGNLTVEEVIIFEGTGTQLNVSGCIKVPSVELNLEGVDDPSKNLPSGPVVLLQQNGYDCPNSLLDSSIIVKQNPESCKKVKVVRDDSKSSPSNLSVVFLLDDSKCSSGTWRWIVLGTVLGVVVLAGILAVLTWQICKSKRVGTTSK